MIDLFAEERPQPKLYIADVTISVIKKKKNSKQVDTAKIELMKVPIVLLDNDFPTNNTKDYFLRRVFDDHIKKGKYEDLVMRVSEIKNRKFSSDLAYKFDYNIN